MTKKIPRVGTLDSWNSHGHLTSGRISIVASMLFLGCMVAYVVAAERGEPQRGKQLYQQYCAACHGSEGTGTGRNAPYLEHMGRAPRDHTDVRYMNRLSDAELYRAISEGKRREGEPPFMPWWGYTLPEESIWDLVAFIRSLAGHAVE